MILVLALWFTLVIGCIGTTHTYDFNVSVIKGNPDGVYERNVIGINNQFPLPTIKVKRHDRVEIFVTNQLENMNTSLHFHGLFQKGQNAMDGPEMVTQCPIPPGFTFLYNFTVDQVGTYWYHSHSGAQYGDGLRGLFIIEDPEPLPFNYDEEVVLSVSDWYHKLHTELMRSFLSLYNPTGAEPIPQNALFNDTRNATWLVEPNKTYLLRIANIGLFASQYLQIEDHTFTIVEADGVYVEPTVTDSLYLAVAQRYSVLVRTKNTTETNYRFLNIIDQDMLDLIPQELQVISTNWLAYNDKELPEAIKNTEGSFDNMMEKLNPVDDFFLKPISPSPLMHDSDHQIVLNLTMENLGDGVQYALFNGKTYTPPLVPTLMTAMTGGEFASDKTIYGTNTQSYVLRKDEVVDIILNNFDSGKHPFHMHGHNFQVISRSEAGDDDDPIAYDPSNPEHNEFPKYPLHRDTVMVNENGFLVIRFKANNPGVWLFHCHVDWHLEQGLAIVLVEAPEDLQNYQSIPANHFESCSLSHVSSKGNAAGRFGPSREQWLDLTGERVQSKPLPEGFTAKGYVAFVICSLAAVYGVFTLYQYGVEDFVSDDKKVLENLSNVLQSYGQEGDNY